MKKIFPIVLLIAFWRFDVGVRAQEEARAAWQVARFDVTANVNQAERALNVRALLSAINVGQGVGRTLTVRLSPQAEVKSASVGNAATTFRNRTDSKTNLQQVTINLPDAIAAGGTTSVAIEYRLPIGENSALAAISPTGAQFLPLSSWYPAPNTQYSLRGGDTAPVHLSVSGGGDGDLTIIGSGKKSGANVFDEALNAQPFFLMGKWETVEGVGSDARGISAHLLAGASADEKRQAENLISLASAARSFYAGALGQAPDETIKLVTVTRGAGVSDTGILLLSPAVFDRQKVDAATALAIGEAMARLWIGGATPLRGEGASVIHEGLVRFLATLFLEKQFGRDAAEAERARERNAYATIAKRDGPLAQSTPFFDTHFNATANKGAMIWRLIDRALGRDAFLALLNSELQAKREGGLTLASLRAAIAARGGSGVRNLMDYGFDQPTEMDLLIGLPQQRGGEWVSALRNTGAIDATVTAVGITETGERVTAQATIPTHDFGEAHFKTTGRIARVEVDPEKFYPQIDYNNDDAPRPATEVDPLAEAARLFARQEYAKAEAMARASLAAAPQMQEARIILARALLGAGKNDEAGKEFKAVLNDPLPLSNAYAWANVGLGDIASRQGQTADAVKFYEQAIRADAEYGATLAARQGRLKAEAAAGNAPAIDESARAFITQLDAAIRGGRKSELDALVVPGELGTFIKGIVGNQPEVWQTKVVRTERLDANRLAADVALNTKILGKDEAGTALYLLTRVGGNWKLSGVEFFEVR